MIFVRIARPEDWDDMTSTFRAAGATAWSHIFGSAALADLAPASRWLESITNPKPHSRFWVAEYQRRLAGFATVCPSLVESDEPETAELDALYTHPDVWGKGVGRRLLSESVDFARREDFNSIKLWTAELNHRPRAIYEKSGWLLTGATRSRNLFGTDFVELRYELPLKG